MTNHSVLAFQVGTSTTVWSPKKLMACFNVKRSLKPHCQSTYQIWIPPSKSNRWSRPIAYSAVNARPGIRFVEMICSRCRYYFECAVVDDRFRSKPLHCWAYAWAMVLHLDNLRSPGIRQRPPKTPKTMTRQSMPKWTEAPNLAYPSYNCWPPRIMQPIRSISFAPNKQQWWQ